MKYTVFVNQKEYEVDRLAYICHCTRQVPRIQPYGYYRDYVLNYKFNSNREVMDYIKMYLDRPKLRIKDRYKVLGKFIESARQSLMFAANIAEYWRHYQVPKPKVDSSYFYIKRIVNNTVNFPIIEVSEAYEKLPPLMFYHSLIHKLENDCVVRREQISIDKINIELGFYNLTYEDVKEDIKNHLILIEKDGYYEWADKGVRDWLWKSDYTDVYRCNLYKLLSKIKYESNYY